jgi:hypothetical protein
MCCQMGCGWPGESLNDKQKPSLHISFDMHFTTDILYYSEQIGHAT